MPTSKQKNAIQALTPTPNLTQTETLATTLMLVQTQTQNLNCNTNDNTLKNKRVNEQVSTQSCSVILYKQSLFAC